MSQVARTGACNGRAHPTAMLGAMGLHRLPGYVARAAACGGRPNTDQYVELYVEGTVTQVARILRQASITAGGVVAVARNPVTASYARAEGAPGAVRQAINLGMTMLEAQAKGPEHMIRAAASAVGGAVICRGSITEYRLTEQGGFDVGCVVVTDGPREYELSFCNEFMAIELLGKRITTYPALIAVLSIETGLPLTSAELSIGLPVAVLSADADRLHLGAGLRDPALYRELEQVLDKEIVKYIFAKRS